MDNKVMGALQLSLRQPHILWLELERFYAEPAREPVVVVRDGFVLDANDAARARGIQLGIPLRQVRTLLQEGKVVNWARENYEKRSRAWMDPCVALTGVIEPADQHAAWLDLSLHPNPIDVADKLICTLTKKTKLTIRYGAAPSKWLACLAAKHDDCGLALRDPKKFLAPLSVSELLPVAPEHRERLLFLGYYHIGDVAKLSLLTLQEQFAEAALIIYSAAAGLLAQVPKAFYPPSSITDCFVFDGLVESTEVIDQACGVLARRVGERLLAQASQSAKLRATLELEDGSLKRLGRTFAKPMRCPQSVRSALRLLLEPALATPITAIRVFLPDLVKTCVVQPTFLNALASKEPQQAASALREIRTVFGDTSVRLGSEIVLSRRVKVLREWKHATGWR
ncbi:MAG: DNA polymerase Y family protein [Fimbriimonadaceae bacterium]